MQPPPVPLVFVWPWSCIARSTLMNQVAMDHLSGFQVGSYPVHYIPNFISDNEEAVLLRKITQTPAGKWRNLSNRRLQVWGGELTKSGTLIPQDLPAFVTSFPNIIQKLRETGAFDSTPQGVANHIILNEYLPGQGITPHQDGPAYHPVVATLSLGSHTVMDYYQYRRPSDASDTAIDAVTEAGKIIDPAPILCLLLEPRSLVITHGDLYTEHLHGITGANQDVFIASSNSYSDRQKASWEQDNVQVVCAQDLANRELLGETILRDKLMRLAIPVAERGEEPQIGDAVELERRTRTSLTCRVVEKTAAAAGKLLRLR